MDQRAIALGFMAQARERLRALAGTELYLQTVRACLLAELHAAQREVVDAIDRGERYITLCCGRRGGKTRALSTIAVMLLLRLKHGEEVVFVAPTLKRGKELIWNDLMMLLDAYQLDYVTRAHQGTIQTPRGGLFRIVGLDNHRQIGKIARGGNTRAFLADEVQEFSHLLQELLDAATPALGQTRGVFIASGTPGFVRRGFWFDVCHGKDGFIAHSWTMFDNPFLGRPAHEIVEEEIARKGWPRDHPTLLREWYAKWLDDASRKVFELADHNIVEQVDDYNRLTWRHFIGVDYGHSPDPCAWVVLAAHPHKNLVLAVHAEKQHRLTSDQICERTNELRVAFNAKRIVGDSASGGKTFIADFNERHARRAGFHMASADKADKRDSIDLVNTELRTGRLLLLREEAKPLIEEMQALTWDEDHEDMLPGEDHVCDSTRYALRALRAFLAKPPKAAMTEEEKELSRIKARNDEANRALKTGGFFG